MPRGRRKNKEESEELLTREQAAAYLRVATQTLAIWHTTGRYSLRAIKVGRLVRYRRSDLDAFLAARTTDRSQKANPSTATSPDAPPPSREIEFAEVRVVDPVPTVNSTSGALELAFPGGMTLRISDGCSMDLLAQVVSVLGGH